MPDNKLVIRRLPPTMQEDEFLKLVSPLPNHDYFSYFESSSGRGAHSFSRAYINFPDQDDMIVFRERYNNYVFLDKDGHEYQAVVEQALWDKCPKCGPFYSGHDRQEPKRNLIEEDPNYLEFLEKLGTQKKRPQHSPIQTLENNLDELAAGASSKDNMKVITPLIGFINQKRNSKSTRKTK